MYMRWRASLNEPKFSKYPTQPSQPASQLASQSVSLAARQWCFGHYFQLAVKPIVKPKIGEKVRERVRYRVSKFRASATKAIFQCSASHHRPKLPDGSHSLEASRSAVHPCIRLSSTVDSFIHLPTSQLMQHER